MARVLAAALSGLRLLLVEVADDGGVSDGGDSDDPEQQGQQQGVAGGAGLVPTRQQLLEVLVYDLELPAAQELCPYACAALFAASLVALAEQVGLWVCGVNTHGAGATLPVCGKPGRAGGAGGVGGGAAAAATAAAKALASFWCLRCVECWSRTEALLLRCLVVGAWRCVECRSAAMRGNCLWQVTNWAPSCLHACREES